LQITKLKEDNKALDRLTKSKEAALLEVEKTVKTALAKASLVDDLQNRNKDLTKQIDICQVYIGNTAIVLLCPVPFFCRISSKCPFFRRKTGSWTDYTGKRLRRLKI
jgi:predicted neuraminidase